MTLSQLEGQPRALEALRAALAGSSVHHAYLFEGPEGAGQEDAAVGFAQALLCREKPGEGCGVCATCGRVARRNHPDVTWVMPEEELVARGIAGRADFAAAPSRDIRVEQIRGLQDRLSRRALEGKRKLALLVDAERMNPQAQNAFLKTLEEPPPETVLLLLATSSDRLLPTLRSRCVRIAFGPLPAKWLAQLVRKERGLDEETAALVAEMSCGSATRALAFDVEGLARRKEIIERFEELRSGGPAGMLRFAEAFGASREDAEEALRVLGSWVRDVAVVRGGGKPLSGDLIELATDAARRVSEPALHRRAQLLDQAMEAVTARNGSPRMQLERMLIEMGVV